ncbi:polymer-forming cytoskeletal protein [Halobacteria archaeon AArc-m2/3/4]|uniref:Polymer-forming cytoskeletal protein n=1 Tax=Natronoglomus mannanivorans TaxID=2979990 RepID=A0ABT2QHH5_9EURY|nr:polymer-forming cytoskeletal protein [Halobacteria archaeon AArc-m2/3/4]
MAPIIKLAVVCILVGAVLLIGPTVGFSQIEADRGVAVQTATDDSAFLEITDRSSTASLSNAADAATVYDLRMASESLSENTVSATLVGIVDGQGSTAPPTALEAFPVADGTGDISLLVQCVTEGGIADGSYILEIAMQATGSGVTVDAVRSTGTPVPISCGEPPTDEDITVIEDEPGNVETTGNVTVENGNDVNGDVSGGGSVTLDNGASVSGNISSGGDTTVSNNGNVGGGIESGGTVTINNNGNIGGGITAEGDIILTNNGIVNGDVISYNGNIEISNNGEVRGDVIAHNGTVCIGNNAVVTGHVIAGQGTC